MRINAELIISPKRFGTLSVTIFPKPFKLLGEVAPFSEGADEPEAADEVGTPIPVYRASAKFDP